MLEDKCAFNHIYKFDADHIIGGVSIRDVRINLANGVADYLKKNNKHYDFVSAIPNTGYYYAEQVANKLDTKFVRIFEKKIYKRTLGSNRDKRVSIYDSILMSVSKAELEGHILFIDEALLSGLSVQVIADACREIGIKKYSFAFMSPITFCQCPWGHIKNTSRWFDSLNLQLPDIDAIDINKHLLDKTNSQEIIHCPPDVFCNAVDCSMHCTLCFYDYMS